jgi:predicted ester cyclase
MTENETRTVMDGYLGSLRSRGDFAAFFAPDVLWTFMESGDQVRGRDAVRDLIVDMHTRAFDAHPELRSLAVGDGVAMVEVEFVGTHAGEFAGVPPTGLAVRLPYSVAYDVADGAITALRAYFPTTVLLGQLSEAARAAASPAHV